MKVIAPGKVLLFGAYSVLEGTQALVVAVDRYAIADTERVAPSSSREVRAAIGDEPAPELDLTSLHQGGRSSASGRARRRWWRRSARGRRSGGRISPISSSGRTSSSMRSGRTPPRKGGERVDIAASTYGGALFYSMIPEVDPLILQAELPKGLALRVLWSGRSARTSELLAKVKKLDAKDRPTFKRVIGTIGDCVKAARHACAANDVAGFVAAGRGNAQALAELGREADAPIVPPAFAELALVAAGEGGAFYPSGAGGGDVGVWLGTDPPSEGFLEQARSKGMFLLELGMDRAGVRLRKD